MMSTVGTDDLGGLQRPYTLGTFQKRLVDFQELIKELTLQDLEATPEERRQLITENLRYDQFCDSIRHLFGADIRNTDLKALYKKISTNPDAKVDWSELFGYFQSENDEFKDLTGTSEDNSVFTVSKKRRIGEAAGDRKRRDTLQCLKYVKSIDCYITGSQKGALSVWSTNLKLQACTDINESAWVTGCDFLPGVRRVTVCTERSICLWDYRGKGKNQNIFYIRPFEDSPQCMCHIPNDDYSDSLLFGDDQGYVNLMILTAKDLTAKHEKGDKNFRPTYELDPHKGLQTPIVRRRIHDDWVLSVKYIPELKCFASCSASSISSFVLEEVDRLYDDGELRGVSIPKGVNCFDFCSRANIIATGGVDKIIRVWHPHIFSRPTGKLIGHLFTIIDICCNEKDQHIISLSTARVFRVWDIHTLTSLQVFTDNEERPGEKRIYGILFDNKHDRLVSGSSVIDAWPLTRAVQDTMQVPHTHDRSLSQILYNSELNQMITICTESVIKVWETETGKQVYQIPEAHGPNIEITSLALDGSGYRFSTGGLDGSLKVWDFGSGQEIKWKQGQDSQDDLHSITGLHYTLIDSQRCLIVTGWNNTVQIVQDINENQDFAVVKMFSDKYVWNPKALSQQTHWDAEEENPFNRTKPLPGIGNSPRPHDDDDDDDYEDAFQQDFLLREEEVACMCGSLPETMVTGCSSGNIITWDVEHNSVDKMFVLPERSKSRNKEDDDYRVNTIKVLIHRVRKLDPAYIKSKLTRHEKDDDDTESIDEMGDVSSNNDDITSKRHSKANVMEVTKDTAKSGIGSRTVSRAISKTSQSAHSKGGEKKDPSTQSGLITILDETNVQEEWADANDIDKSSVAEKTSKVAEEAAEDDDITQDNPEDHMIVENFPPIIVSCHQDAFIRFWDMEGHLLREVSAVTRRQASAVTALCTDQDCNYMITGDNKGYLTLWEIGDFLKDPESERHDVITQTLCWRGHTTKVTSLSYVDDRKCTVSGSTDGSVRVWWGFKGRFVGFFGQARSFHFPSSEETASTPVLPYDISERPLAHVKTKSAKQKLRTVHKLEYPLVFDNTKWKPFRRASSLQKTSSILEPTKQPIKSLEAISSPRQPITTANKFFEALIKPRAYNSHLESFDNDHVTMEGAVYRTLPVYRVKTPEPPATPTLMYATLSSNDKGTKKYREEKQKKKTKASNNPPGGASNAGNISPVRKR